VSVSKNRYEVLAFYDLPTAHWVHLWTTNPIESTFATVRLRNKKTKGSGSRTASLTMVLKRPLEVAKRKRQVP
jgi:putative transposase